MTGSSFSIGTSQIGSTLRATVTATNSAGKSSAFSNLTSDGARGGERSPVNSSLPLDLRLAVGRPDASGLDGRLDRRRGERVQLPVEPL